MGALRLRPPACGVPGLVTCINENAVLVSDDEAAARQVMALIDNALAYKQIANSAVQTWQAKPLYREDVMTACGDLIGQRANKKG